MNAMRTKRRQRYGPLSSEKISRCHCERAALPGRAAPPKKNNDPLVPERLFFTDSWPCGQAPCDNIGGLHMEPSAGPPGDRDGKLGQERKNTVGIAIET